MDKAAHSWRSAERARFRVAFTACIFVLVFTAASAQTPVTGFSGIGGDNAKKPIDIESDRLEVDDKKQVATFIGNVSATQGDYNLRSPKLDVTYEKSQPADKSQSAQAKGTTAPQPAKLANTPAPSSGGDPLSSGQIRMIHATGGKVIVTSKKDEQEAVGEDAVYDVRGQKIVMTGKEVILTQKKNVVTGTKLVIDLATGVAKVDTPGRIRAKFEQEGKNALAGTPFGKKKDGAADDTSKSPPPAAPGWKTQSR